jgi:hypothetical protein
MVEWGISDTENPKLAARRHAHRAREKRKKRTVRVPEGYEPEGPFLIIRDFELVRVIRELEDAFEGDSRARAAIFRCKEMAMAGKVVSREHAAREFDVTPEQVRYAESKIRDWLTANYPEFVEEFLDS